MYSSIVILVAVMAVSLWCVAMTVQLLLRIVRGRNHRLFFSGVRSRLCDNFGRDGISLLCRDTGDEERLRNLLAVEYPTYEVVVVADSLRSPESLQRIIATYRMIAVDGRMSGDRDAPRVRRMYRSASRCYRRLLLLDVVTCASRSDLDVALDVATYDYLLPLWGDEYLAVGAIERLVAEVCTAAGAKRSVITTCVGAPLKLIPRCATNQTEAISSIEVEGREHVLYEPLAWRRGASSLAGRVVVLILWVAVMLCMVAVAVGVAPLAMGVIALSVMLILASACLSTAIIASKDDTAVGYGDTLYLFCKNLLPSIWQIRK